MAFTQNSNCMDIDEQGRDTPDRLSSREALIKDLLQEVAELRHEKAKVDRQNYSLRVQVEQLRQRLTALEKSNPDSNSDATTEIPSQMMTTTITVAGPDWAYDDDSNDENNISTDSDFESPSSHSGSDSDSDDIETASEIGSEPEYFASIQSEAEIGKPEPLVQLVFDIPVSSSSASLLSASLSSAADQRSDFGG